MKKFFALMLVVTAMVISGCAKSDTTPPADTKKEEPAATEPAGTEPAAPPAETK